MTTSSTIATAGAAEGAGVAGGMVASSGGSALARKPSRAANPDNSSRRFFAASAPYITATMTSTPKRMKIKIPPPSIRPSF